MKQRDRQSGFGRVEIVFISFVIAAVAVTGLVLYQRHTPSNAKNSAATGPNQTTTQPQSTTTAQTAQATAQYLVIKEWGVKIPLSGNIKDAYYTVPLGISRNADGRPSGITLGLTSLNNACGTVASSGSGADRALGEIVRTLPTEHEPVSGKLYSQLNPDGTTIGSYYYGYEDFTTSYYSLTNSGLFVRVNFVIGSS